MRDPDRNYYIAAAVAGGRSVAEVAEEHGLQPSRIRTIAAQQAWMLPIKGDQLVPEGLTIRAAVAVKLSLGLWPAAENAPQIAQHRMDILRSKHGRRFILADIDRWINSLNDEPLLSTQ
jgi:hypothetical protein